ncbi:MAG: CehA/McbA family metallohydrolase [Bacillota bacterium]|nr:CehA/McbA family metallohydrolase [Bacillota bacterium]HHU42776.1 CehA/McbA family metallohydrolase [Clostridiales bacterium]
MSRYYPFELHCHTNHSDGDMSPAELVQRAVERGLSGIAITDHNTYSAVEEVAIEGKKRNLTVIEGIEWTTFWGHIVALGKTDIDWRDLNPKNIDQILAKAHSHGLTLTLAHPKRYGTPICTGCFMDLPITKYEYISAYEVWTQKCPNFSDYNEKAIREYDELLQKGYRIAAIYGYDWHRPDPEERPFAVTFLGYKEEPCRAIKDGDTYVSIGLMIDIKINGKSLPFGSSLKSGEYQIEAGISRFNERYFKKHDIKPEKIVATGSALKQKIEFEPNQKTFIKLTKGYVRFEVVGQEKGHKGKKLLLTSPYYIDKGE